MKAYGKAIVVSGGVMGTGKAGGQKPQHSLCTAQGFHDWSELKSQLWLNKVTCNLVYRRDFCYLDKREHALSLKRGTQTDELGKEMYS